MSDDDYDIDVESDESEYSDSSGQLTPSPQGSSSSNSIYYSQYEKRAHHNALERKRRDHIKDSFTDLRDAVPILRGVKAASRAQILKKAAEYICTLRKRNNAKLHEITVLEKQSNNLDAQIQKLERRDSARSSDGIDDSYSENSESDSSEEEEFVDPPRRKKTRTDTSTHQVSMSDGRVSSWYANRVNYNK